MYNYLKRLQKIWSHPANRNSRLNAIWRAFSWQLTSKQTKKPIDVDAFGYSIRLYPDAFETRGIIYYTPYQEYHSMKFIESYLSEGDSFLDIGANIGIYSLLASSLVGKNGSVESFEPCPATYNRLEENITRNLIMQVNLHNLALGEKEGIVKLTTEYDATNFVVKNSSNIHSKIVTVPCKRLDHFFEAYRNFAMAKIDVEGYELSVLKGATSLLESCNPPVIQLEINGSYSRYGIDNQDIIAFLKQYGYEPAIYNADTNDLIFTEKNWDEILFINKQYKNKIFNKINSNPYKK